MVRRPVVMMSKPKGGEGDPRIGSWCLVQSVRTATTRAREINGRSGLGVINSDTDSWIEKYHRDECPFGRSGPEEQMDLRPADGAKPGLSQWLNRGSIKAK